MSQAGAIKENPTKRSSNRRGGGGNFNMAARGQLYTKKSKKKGRDLSQENMARKLE